MTWGAPASNRAPLAYGLRQAEMLDLRRFWLSDVPPANAESRALSVACRLIGKQYPRLRLLTTYCDTEERAAAYRAAGWLAQGSWRYVTQAQLPDGGVISIREVNRRGGRRKLPEGYRTILADRRKWVFVLDESLRATVVRIGRTLANQAGNDGSNPIRSLQNQEI